MEEKTMLFPDRLKKLRDEFDISQEQLAEKLNVSRQAVTKWEAGTTMPDIINLVEISKLFLVSLDHLLKDTNYPCKTMTIQCEAGEIVKFIVEAKKNTYANFGSNKVEPSRLESTDLFYESGDFKYLDTYVGGGNFSGTEVVYYKDSPVWSMNYIGRLLYEEENNSIEFLTRALGCVNMAMPYRGPVLFREGKYIYMNTVNGEFDWFQGCETIYYEDLKAYELVYHGGLVK
jgi:transcriptional regulator with XRE-family HTH domain